MKKIISGLLAALVLSTAGVASAQDLASSVESEGPKNTITANPFLLLFGAFNFEYERAVSPRLSWYVAPSYWSYSVSAGSGEASSSAYGLGGGLRYFLTGTAPEGFFVSPGVSLAYATTDFGTGADAFGYDISAVGGYTWIFGGVFDLSLGLGVAYREMEVKAGGMEIGQSGIVPTGRLALGAAF